LTPADLAAITQAVVAGMPPPPVPVVRDFVAEQNLKDRRTVLQKLLHPYDGTRKVKVLRRWLEVQENYLKTFVPLVANPAPPPAFLAGPWPAGLPRELLFSHLKTQVEKGAQTLHDVMETEVDPVTLLPTVNTFTQYEARFVANFLPATVRNEVESHLKAMRFTGSINRLVEDFREQIEEVTAANQLSGGVQATFSNLELALLFQDMFRRSNYPDADKMFTQIADFRTSFPNASINAIMERAVAYWATLGHIDDSTSTPRTTITRREDAYVARGRGRGMIRGRGTIPFQPYPTAMTCHFCGGVGHRSDHCLSNPGATFGAYHGTGGYRGRGGFRGAQGYGRGSPAARGGFAGRGRTAAQEGTPNTTVQTSGQGAGRGQGQTSRGRGFPFGPRYRQPYRVNPYYGPQSYGAQYDVNYQEYHDEGFGYDEHDPYVINEHYVEHYHPSEQQYNEQEMLNISETTAEAPEETVENPMYQDFS